MVTRANRRGRSGFTLTELVVVIAIVGILAGIMIPRLVGADKAASIAAAVNMNRELQVLAEDYYSQYMMPPSMADLQSGYSRNGNTRVNEKFAIFNTSHSAEGDSAAKSYGGSSSGGASRYVICSIMDIKGASYVYSMDDNPPVVAYEGEDPVGGGICGPGRGPVDTTPTGDDDDDSATGDDDTGSSTGSGDDDSGSSTGSHAGDDDSGPGSGGDDDGNTGSGSGDDDSGSAAADDDDDNSGAGSGSGDDDSGGDDDEGGVGSTDDDDDATDDDAADDDDDPMSQVEAQCPCDGEWKNHGDYVNCAEKAINKMKKDGQISKKEKTELKQAVNVSDCGEPEHQCSRGRGNNCFGGRDDDDDHGHDDDHGRDDDHKCER